ncbi:DUF6583 family protein [Ornithinibacillus halotolerans]|uniref:Uncharacterized protein n=1 Tax=Ornithinibacillus halotolerans TaxID=1274357 RepID=A0A916S6T0_9BACI|nr:DUF6583 family protein [Ornithinibacillus halotolerans]GGA86381.1 hypothetical protein GCM10008025_31620 [Ornithinibacillus halotolerans]
MEDYNQDVKLKKKGFTKLTAIIVAAVVLLLGGSVAAFVLLDNNSPKQSYFLSEKNTFEFFEEQLKERYESEIEWSEKSQENPIQDIYELSAEVNMPLSDGTAYVTPEQIINNSTITITTGLDYKEKVAAAEIQGGFGNFTIEDINVYLTEDRFMLGLPFINEILQLKGDDFGKLGQQFDPTFTGEEKIDFGMFFDRNIMAEEDIKYLEEEYGKEIYDALPDEAFESADETVKIGDDNIKTEKITFHLTEEQVKKILTDTLSKMAEDERLKEILLDYVQTQVTGPVVFGEGVDLGLSDFESEFETAMQDAIDGLDSFVIPNGFTSTIWVSDDVIVKRDFSMEMGPTNDQLVTFYISGTLKKNETDVTFDYDFGVEDQGIDYSLSLVGELSNDDGNIQDKITVSVDSIQLIYESNETLKDSKRDFDRTVSFIDETGYQFDLIWTGNSEYDGDQMNSSHEFTVGSDDIMQDLVILYVDKESKLVDSIELPNEDEVKDIGSMSIDEITSYFENDVMPEFEKWMMGIIGFGF